MPSARRWRQATSICRTRLWHDENVRHTFTRILTLRALAPASRLPKSTGSTRLPWHPHIQNQTGRVFQLLRLKEVLSGGKCAARNPADQTRLLIDFLTPESSTIPISEAFDSEAALMQLL
jgi:hypothetical protein